MTANNRDLYDPDYVRSLFDEMADERMNYVTSFGFSARWRRQASAGWRSAGLEAHYADYFFGCASGVWGSKP